MQFLPQIVVLALLTPSSAFQLVPGSNSLPVVTVSSSTSLNAVSRREALTAASAATVLIASGGIPTEALAVTKSTAPDTKKFAFNGVFKDPKHPGGFRIIALAPGKEGTMTVQDAPDGQVFQIPIKAKTDDKGQTILDIDFSEKGGPSDVVATVSKKDNSIVFPDGNIWKKDTNGVVGVYVDGFAPYPKYRRIIREADNKNDLVVCMVSGKKTFVISGKQGNANRSGNREVVIDFPGDKSCGGKVNSKKGTITFPDGNVWTRV